MKTQRIASTLSTVPFLVAVAGVDPEWAVVGVPVLAAAGGNTGAVWFGLGGLLVGVLGILLINCRRQTKARAYRDVSLREFSSRLIYSQEQERKRIAHELHDSLGQDLLLIKTSAQLAARNPETDLQVRARLNQIISLASRAVGEVRSITDDLRPPELDRLGLAATVEAMGEKVSENSSLKIECGVDGVDNQLAKDDEINLYRIIQECLNNALKHSGARRVKIGAHRVNGDLHVTISDDGRGFDPSECLDAGSVNGMGLLGLAERTRTLGGRLHIDSAPGKGARVSLTIPIRDDERQFAS